MGLKYKIQISCLLLFFGCKSQNKLNPEQQKKINQTKANFVFVEGGTFLMGHESFQETTPKHQVTLDSYSISKYETTWGEFDLYTELEGLDKIVPNWRHEKELGSNYGVKFITFKQARAYCKWLGLKLQLPIDLPTEAQWEYAARSRGLELEHATNNGRIEGGDKDNYGTDRVVGSYPPNPLGLYDMSGGRSEWVRDWFTIYPENSVTNPVQDTIVSSKDKIARGAHTLTGSVYRRARRDPDNDGSNMGIRCVCNQKTPIN